MAHINHSFEMPGEPAAAQDLFMGQMVPELSAADNIAVPLLLNRVNRRAVYQHAHTWLRLRGAEGCGGREIVEEPPQGGVDRHPEELGIRSHG